MGSLLQGLGLIGALQAAASVVLFPLVLLMVARRTPDSDRRWVILRRGDRHVALAANDHSFSTALGFAFAVLFYWGIPLWWWRWGLKRMLALLLVPIVAAIGIAQALNALEQGINLTLMSIALMVVGRVAAGFYVRRNDRRLRLSAYESRGWLPVDIVEATTALGALQTALPGYIAPSALQRLRGKLQRRTS